MTLRRMAIVALGLALGLALVLAPRLAVMAQEDHPEEPFAVAIPAVALSGIGFDVEVRGFEESVPPELEWEVRDRAGGRLGAGHIDTRDESGALRPELALEDIRAGETGTRSISIHLGERSVERQVRVIPGWLSILPPLLAILLAVAFRQVVLALLSGVWLGAAFANGFDPFAALLRTADTYARNALADPDHASIIIFSLLLGGMIGVITRSGGGVGLARLVTRRANKSRGGLLSTWVMGIVIFFDDYANALLVGSTMRPITDRLRISREKLAFVVDATAAPVSSLALISSWIGVEVGYIADQFAARDIPGDAYIVFLETIPYRFYPILMLVFGLLIILMKRDFGPMRRAELRAREHGKVLADEARPAADFEGEGALSTNEHPSWLDAVVPIGVVVLAAVVGMYLNGHAAALEKGVASPGLRDVFGNADSYAALTWAALLGCVAGIVTSVARRSLTLREALDAWLAGIKSMILAMIILILAWSLGSICRELHTAEFLITAIGDWMPPTLLPALVFVVAAAVSFATGTSWGTMAILFPLVIPMADELAPGDHGMMLGAVSSILAGSVWGDHCSPISDTTIMSSMASSCDHVDHVRTQLPYALLVGVVSLIVGDVATGLGLYPAPVGLLLGGLVLFGVVRWVGRPIPDYEPTD